MRKKKKKNIVVERIRNKKIRTDLSRKKKQSIFKSMEDKLQHDVVDWSYTMI